MIRSCYVASFWKPRSCSKKANLFHLSILDSRLKYVECQLVTEDSKGFLAEYYLYGVRNCVVDCTCKSSIVLSAVLRGHRFGILPPTRNQYVLQQSHEMVFHEKYLLVKRSPISLWGCFVTIRGPISRLSDLLERRSILSETLKLPSVLRPFIESVIILLAHSVFLSVLFLNSRIRTEDYPAPCINVPDVESGVDEHTSHSKNK
jgi:hypothetical protein